MPSNSQFRGFVVPTVGGDTGIWGGELNATINDMDACFGYQLNLYSSTNGNNVTPSSSQAFCSTIFFQNVSSSPAQLNLTASNGFYGRYAIFYSTPNFPQPLQVTVGSSVGGGVFIGAGFRERSIFTDGGGIFLGEYSEVSAVVSLDGGFSTPPSGQKPSFPLPFNFWLQSWQVQADSSGASGSMTFGVFNTFFNGTLLHGSGTTPTFSGFQNSGGVSGYIASILPIGTVLSPNLVSPAGGWVHGTVNLIGYKI